METVFATYIERRISLSDLKRELSRLPLAVLLAAHGIDTALPYTAEPDTALHATRYTQRRPRVLPSEA